MPIASLLAALLLATGCMVHRPSPDLAPITPARQTFQQAMAEPPPDSTLAAPWWRAFEDPLLDALIDEALARNLGLQQLAQRITQAEALRRQTGATLLPSIAASGTYETSWSGLENGGDAVRSDSASAGAFLDWELDVWGRLRSARAAQARETQAARYDQLAAQLFLSAAVTETYFEILEQRSQLRLLNEQIAVNETLLDLTRLRFGQGLSSVVDVLQQREQLVSTRALVPEIEARAGELIYALDVLLGRAPGSEPAAFDALPAAPTLYARTGVPSDLLAQRPDLLAVQHRITALDYRVGAAIADRLPRFAIGGALSAAGDPTLSTLIGSAFASVTGPLFDAGERKAVVDLRRAQLNEAIADFSNQYLEAVRDVEIALLRERKQVERLALQEMQLDAAKHLLAETRNRYRQGLTDYLPVLAAVTTEQNLERELITSRRERLSLRVTLHRALGGPLPHPPMIASGKSHDE